MFCIITQVYLTALLSIIWLDMLLNSTTIMTKDHPGSVVLRLLLIHTDIPEIEDDGYQEI